MDTLNDYLGHQMELEKAYDFSAEVLELNRIGQLSPAQSELLESHRTTQGCGYIAGLSMLTIMTIVMIVVLYQLLFAANLPGIEEGRRYILGVFGLVLGVMLFSALRMIAVKRHMTQGKVSTMEGVVKTWSRTARGEYSHLGEMLYFKVGRKKFQLDTKEKWQTLNTGQRYRFFYVRNGPVPIILSIEWLAARPR